MNRATLERLAAVLVLGACICAECIPLLVVLVAAAALCVGVTNCQALVNLRKKKRGRRCCEHRAAKRKKLIRPYFRGLEGDCQV